MVDGIRVHKVGVASQSNPNIVMDPEHLSTLGTLGTLAALGAVHSPSVSDEFDCGEHWKMVGWTGSKVGLQQVP
jgi:hypothetical protein